MLKVEEGFGIPASLISDVFPFHFAYGHDLEILQVGKSLLKLCPRMVPGAKIPELVRIITPVNIAFDIEQIAHQLFTVFFVEILENKFVLKGQMVRLVEAGKDSVMFLCTPVVRDLDSVAGMGLTLNDFAIHDAAQDFLILLQTKSNTINDVRKMADRLKQEVLVRREAEKSLKLANEDLENRVDERTKELSHINQEMELEIFERKRMGDELQVANLQLNSMVKKLEIHNRQISLLNKMGDMLQACRSVKETYGVIADAAQEIFPKDSGFLSLYVADEDRFQVVTIWGKVIDSTEIFKKEDCWGLRRAKIHSTAIGNSNAHCGHMANHVSGISYICAPLMVQGDILGMLHLQSDDCKLECSEAEVRKNLVKTAAEHIGLAVANLKLQDSLRQQSIRDALTGLYNRRHMEVSLEREILRARRNQFPVSIIMVDVDHFKNFNDTLGHQAGDALLQALGGFLESQVRGEDIACRYGGEEFILILPTAGKDIAMKRAEQICFEAEHHLKVEFNGALLPQVTLSLGVAVFPDSADSAREAVAAADAALYHSKQTGRNRATFATPEILVAATKH